MPFFHTYPRVFHSRGDFFCELFFGMCMISVYYCSTLPFYFITFIRCWPPCSDHFHCSFSGSAYSPLPLRTHTQDPQAREMEEASDHHPVSLNSSHHIHNNHGSSNLHHAAVASIVPNLNAHGGLQSSHYQNSHGGPAGSSHPIPSTKKKPAPLPPVRTPPTPPKKAPLRLPAENT